MYQERKIKVKKQTAEWFDEDCQIIAERQNKAYVLTDTIETSRGEILRTAKKKEIPQEKDERKYEQRTSRTSGTK